MVDSKERILGDLDKLFQDLNVISVIAFSPVFIYIATTVGSALDGRPAELLYALPWLILMVAYWYWRYRYLRVRCRDYARAMMVPEYERTIRLDSVRTVILGATVISTLFFFLLQGDSASLFAALFIGGLLVYSILVGVTYFSYWANSWLASRRAGD
ncbi:MAG: hypothetical protein LN415_01390 [Candidatus Thermoplasmatota archaeon]|nr:hypothetical protein [Candidatus Thermoplasmatota archaeon]